MTWHCTRAEPVRNLGHRPWHYEGVAVPVAYAGLRLIRSSQGDWGVATIRKWTGREARALREALRMSIRDFAARLGVSERAVSKWEAGGAAMTPRPDSQALLDTTLELSLIHI